MKKFLSVLLAAAFGMTLAFSASAIEDPDRVGSITVGAHGAYFPGLGFGGNVFGDYVLIDSWWKGHFTVGGQAAAYIDKDSFTQGAMGYKVTWNYTYTNICLVPRATYGLNITPQLEVHAGALLGFGYQVVNATLDSNIPGVESKPDISSGPHLIYGEILGARYFFSDNFGASAELNWSNFMPYVNVGVAYRF